MSDADWTYYASRAYVHKGTKATLVYAPHLDEWLLRTKGGLLLGRFIGGISVCGPLGDEYHPPLRHAEQRLAGRAAENL